jgi:hypothetical protein
MQTVDRLSFKIVYVIVAAVGVYVFAHWNALTNQYVIADDVRQQIYWMQQWQDPDLFRGDLLTEYAKNYVPLGVKSIYFATARLMNPVQFTKVVTGVLYVITALLFFGIGRRFGDDLTALFIVCGYFFSAPILDKMAGGISQSFSIPLLAAYVLSLGRGKPVEAGFVILCASLFNPYICLLCLVTHLLYLSHVYGPTILGLLVPGLRLGRGADSGEAQKSSSDQAGPTPPLPAAPPTDLGALLYRLIAQNAPVATAVGLMAVQYVFFKSTDFGALVTWRDMAGKVEYTLTGRYEIVPVKSFFYELIRPFHFVSPEAAPFIFGALCIGAILSACVWRKVGLDHRGFRPFVYLWIASVVLYLASYIFLMKLFLPRRYVECPAHVFYAVLIGIILSLFFTLAKLRKAAFPLLTTVIIAAAALRVYHVGIYDYSSQAQLFRFLESTPASSLIAGHPDLMDNAPTFARRKAFVTYELSHTWYMGYWDIIKKRTYDFFRAYYARDPADVRAFCQANGIDYLLVQDDDFRLDKINKPGFYFEPFQSYVRQLAGAGGSFALLDAKEFPPIYRQNGVSVIKMR